MNEYRQNAINHLKTHLGCVGYRDYLVAELEKLEQIEQIINEWNNDVPWVTSKDIMQSTLLRIQEVLEQEQSHD